MRAISGVSIKSQCSRHNFYGFAPELEKTFGDLEGEAASVIRQVKASQEVPAHGSQQWSTLLGYLVFQKLRTTNTGYMMDAMTDYFGKLWLEGTEYAEDARRLNLKIENVYPAAIPLSLVGSVLPIADDLRMHLLVNKTDREFLTSDDPVVAHNQFCEGISYQGVTGWNCVGLKLFFPLSPTELILLFDPTTYKVGRSHRGSNVTSITDERDVAQLNSLQILNANQNVYYAGFKNSDKTISECNGVAPRRRKTRTTFVETEAKQEGPDTFGSILHMYEPLLPTRLTVSEMTIRRDRRRVPIRVRPNMYRRVIPKTAEQRAAYGEAPPPGRYAVKKITHV